MSELVYVNFLHRIVRGKRERSMGLIFTVDYTCSAVISKTSILLFFLRRFNYVLTSGTPGERRLLGFGTPSLVSVGFCPSCISGMLSFF